MVLVVKNIPAMRGTWIGFLGQESPLEKRMATHSSILAWRISCTDEPGQLQFMDCKELDITEQLTLIRDVLVCNMSIILKHLYITRINCIVLLIYC